MAGKTAMALEGGAEHVNPDGLIDPDWFPVKAIDLDVDRIEAAATGSERLGNRLDGTTSALAKTWQGLRTAYKAPEQEQVYTMLEPATKASAEVKERMSRAGQFIRIYHDEITKIRPDLVSLEARARAFRAEALAGYTYEQLTEYGTEVRHDTWIEHTPAVEMNKVLLEEYVGIVERLMMSSDVLAMRLQTLMSTSQQQAFLEAMGPATSAPSEEEGTAPRPPWGYPAEEQRNCEEQVYDGTKNFIVGNINGINGLLGYDPDTDTRSLATMFANLKAAAIGNYQLMLVLPPFSTLGSFGTFATGVGWKNPVTTTLAQWQFEGTAQAAAIAGFDLKAERPAQNWVSKPFQTATETILNIGSNFIPGGATAAGVRMAGRALRATRAGTRALDAAASASAAAGRVANRAAQLANIRFPTGAFRGNAGGRFLSAVRSDVSAMLGIGDLSFVGIHDIPVPRRPVTSSLFNDVRAGMHLNQASPPTGGGDWGPNGGRHPVPARPEAGPAYPTSAATPVRPTTAPTSAAAAPPVNPQAAAIPPSTTGGPAGAPGQPVARGAASPAAPHHAGTTGAHRPAARPGGQEVTIPDPDKPSGLKSVWQPDAPPPRDWTQPHAGAGATNPGLPFTPHPDTPGAYQTGSARHAGNAPEQPNTLPAGQLGAHNELYSPVAPTPEGMAPHPSAVPPGASSAQTPVRPTAHNQEAVPPRAAEPPIQQPTANSGNWWDQAVAARSAAPGGYTMPVAPTAAPHTPAAPPSGHPGSTQPAPQTGTPHRPPMKHDQQGIAEQVWRPTAPPPMDATPTHPEPRIDVAPENVPHAGQQPTGHSGAWFNRAGAGQYATPGSYTTPITAPVTHVPNTPAAPPTGHPHQEPVGGPTHTETSPTTDAAPPAVEPRPWQEPLFERLPEQRYTKEIRLESGGADVHSIAWNGFTNDTSRWINELPRLLKDLNPRQATEVLKLANARADRPPQWMLDEVKNRAGTGNPKTPVLDSDLPMIARAVTDYPRILDLVNKYPEMPGRYYRGHREDVARVASLEPGQVIADPGFFSASQSKSAAIGFVSDPRANTSPVYYTIDGRPVQPIGSTSDELIFRPNTKFEVVSIERVHWREGAQAPDYFRGQGLYWQHLGFEYDGHPIAIVHLRAVALPR